MSAARCWSTGRYWWRVTRYSEARIGTVVGAVQLGERADVVAEERVLEPLDVVLLERPRDLDRGRQPPEPVAVDHDPHPRPDRLADPAHRLQALLQLVGRDEQAVAREPEVVERPELHGRDALFEQLVRRAPRARCSSPRGPRGRRACRGRRTAAARTPGRRRCCRSAAGPGRARPAARRSACRRPGRGCPRARRRSPRSRGPRYPARRTARRRDRTAFDQWRWICPASLPSSFGAARWWM